MINSLIFYLIGIILIFIFLIWFVLPKFAKNDFSNNFNFYRLGINALLLMFSILFASFYSTVYHPPHPALPVSKNMFFILVESVVLGCIIFIVFTVIIHFTKNFKRKENSLPGTRYAILILFIFILFAIFSFQSTQILSSSNEYNIFTPGYSKNGYEEGRVHEILNENGSMIAYITYHSNTKSYLVVNDLNNGHSAIYSLCYTNSTCLDFSSILSLSFYNNSVILITYNKPFINNPMQIYMMNLRTKVLTLIASNIISIGAFCTFKDTFVYSDIGKIFFLNIFSSSINSTTINGNKGIINDRYAITPDCAHFAFLNSNNTLEFSKIPNINNSLTIPQTNIPISNLSDIGFAHFHFILDQQNPSIIYYSDFNNNFTQLFYYNFTSEQSKLICNLPEGNWITMVNSNESYFSTKNPFEIYSFKNSQIQLLSKNLGISELWNFNGSKTAVWQNNTLFLETYSYDTNILSKKTIVDLSWIPQFEVTFLKVLQFGSYFGILGSIYLIFFCYIGEPYPKENK